jgi:hypothetical protein
MRTIAEFLMALIGFAVGAVVVTGLEAWQWLRGAPTPETDENGKNPYA